MPISDFAFGLFFIVLILAPGLIGIRVYHYVARRKSTLSRIKWVAYSAAVSLISLLIVFLQIPIAELFSLPFVRWIEGIFGLPDSAYFASKSLSELVVLYLFHWEFVIIIAAIVGLGDRLYREEELDWREAWKYAFDEGRAETDTIEVTMNDGTIIRGDFIRKAWDRTRRELYLENPKEVEYDTGIVSGEGRTEEIGRSIYIPEDSFSRIVFLLEDPQSDKADDIEESSEMSNEFRELLEEFSAEDQTNIMELLEDVSENQGTNS